MSTYNFVHLSVHNLGWAAPAAQYLDLPMADITLR